MIFNLKLHSYCFFSSEPDDVYCGLPIGHKVLTKINDEVSSIWEMFKFPIGIFMAKCK